MLALDLLIDHRYHVEQLLGRGGMAEVYRAMDTEAGQPVAVKLLRDVEAGDSERFRIEVAALSRLDHPGVIKLLGSGDHESAPYLVLELVEGRTLADELVDGPLGVDRSIGVAGQLADAIAHAHRLTVVHRDVKPANVLLDADNRARLTDFGTARLADVSGVTATGMVIGTAAYLAPEQVSGERVGPAADIYALGLVVLECLTGARCYPGGRMEAAIARLHRPPAIPDRIPGWLREVLVAMTASAPVRRPSADAVAEAFDVRSAEPVLRATIELTTPITATPVAATSTAPRPAHRTSIMRAAGISGRRSPADRRRSRLAAVAAASVTLAVPAWLFASSDPQSADAPPAPGPVPAAASPAPSTTSATANPPTPVADTPPPPSPDDHVATEKIGGQSKGGRADDKVGEKGGPSGGRSRGKGNGRGNSG
ncbi:MAG: serine/threonine-protein kinase [Acidimicrobiales bacterium]